MSYKGKYRPKNPEKYVGDLSGVVYRSSYELKFMNHLDNSPSVICWSSEEMRVPYISPKDGRKHSYIPDFVIKVKKHDGSIAINMIEIKPSIQTKPPKQQKRQTQKYLRECMTYAINQAKWEAAKAFCDANGWTFIVITEKELNIRS